MEVTAEPNQHPITSLEHFLKAMREFLHPMLEEKMKNLKNIRFSILVNVQYTHPTREMFVDVEKSTYNMQGLQGQRKTLIHPSQIDEKLDAAVEDIMVRNAQFIRDKSGLVLEDIVEFKFFIFRMKNLHGRSYQPLPKFLEKKRAIINVKNTDNRCFAYSMVAALVGIVDHPTRLFQYERHFPRFGLDKISYPVEIPDISDIEDKLQVTINVFSFDDADGRNRNTLYISKKKFTKTVDLLWWGEEGGAGHYAWIKNFHAFMCDLTTKHKMYWCKACLGHWKSENEFKIHQECCRGFEQSGQVFITPEPWVKVAFEHHAYVLVLFSL